MKIIHCLIHRQITATKKLKPACNPSFPEAGTGGSLDLKTGLVYIASLNYYIARSCLKDIKVVSVLNFTKTRKDSELLVALINKINVTKKVHFTTHRFAHYLTVKFFVLKSCGT